jgi:prepilin-type N-terminal cleavage/methylation domain-containing protein
MRRQKGFTLVELLAVMAILAILAGLVAGTVVGLGSRSQSTRLDGDRDSIRKAANAFFLESFPEVYPVNSEDGEVAGIHEIDFKKALPQDPNKHFVPDFLVKLPDSSSLVSWRIDVNSGNVFFAQDGSPLIKPSNNRLDIDATSGALNTNDDHVLTLSMAKDEAAPEVIEIKIPAGYILGGGQADGGTVVGTLQVTLDTDNAFDPGKEVFFGGVIVATDDDRGNPNPDEWALVVDYNFNSSSNVAIKDSTEAVRKHVIDVVRPSGDSAGSLTINFARGSDGAANKATETWKLTLFGSSTDKLTDELNVPSGESAAAGTAFTGFSVDATGLTVPTPDNIPLVALLKNPKEQGVYRWAAEEHSSIDPVVGETLFFNDLPGGQGVLIKGGASATPIPSPSPTPSSTEEPPADTTAPLVIAPPDIEVEAQSESGTPATNPAIAAFLAIAFAVDDVDPVVAVTNDAPSIFPIGDTIVTFSATDAANNTGTATATVTVDPVPSLLTSGIITTVAGTGVAGFSGDSGPATSAQLEFPIGVVTDSQGNLFISDLENDRVRRVDASTGTITTYAGGGIVIPTNFDDEILATSAVLSNPQKLAIDSSDNLYIADKGTKRVRRVDAITGIITTVAGTFGPGIDADNIQAITAELNDISGLAVNAAGDVFIAQWGPGKVRKVDFATGVITTVAGIGTPVGPLGDGGPAINASLDRPASLALDSLGNLYIADAGHSRIRRVDASTQLISTFAGGGSSFSDNVLATATSLNFAVGIAIDGSDNVFIADRFNQRIRRVDSATNLIVTVAGTGTAGFFGDDGPATEAELNHPWEVDVDNSGNLYIADLSNHRVRKVTFSAPVVLELLTIAPATASVTAGLTQQFTVTGSFSDSTSQDLTSSVTWSSNNESAATVDTGGLATGVAAGTATITATLDGIDGSATLDVTAPVVLQSLAITPATPSIAVGLTQQFTATGSFSDSTTQDLTSSVVWSSNNEPVATIAAGGLATGVSDGTATITATLSGIDGSATLNVTVPVVLQSLTISPAKASVAAGLTKQFTALGNFSDGTTQDLTDSVTWTNTEIPVAAAANKGLATAGILGTTIVTATLAGINGTASLNVAALATCGDTLTTHATLSADLDCTGTTGTEIGRAHV